MTGGGGPTNGGIHPVASGPRDCCRRSLSTRTVVSAVALTSGVTRVVAAGSTELSGRVPETGVRYGGGVGYAVVAASAGEALTDAEGTGAAGGAGGAGAVGLSPLHL